LNKYDSRGVSAQKEDVHRAIASLNHGLFPKAFCKIYPDVWGNDPDWCNIMHADGAGTKSALAYIYWKQTGDFSVWKGIATDSIVMNLDDMLCVGATGPFTYSSTIGRNKHLIPGDVISEIINGTQTFFDTLAQYGIDVQLMGGETADLGDLVRTVVVDGTMACRMKRANVITTDGITAGDVVVSFASYGKASYEESYNSGIGSNGLTSARHDLLQKKYAILYPESLDPNLPNEVVYTGPYDLLDKTETGMNVGQMLLSPTRTYAPLIKQLLATHSADIHGIIHCSGGGQTKILHYLPAAFRIVKNNLLPIPPLFNMIKLASGSTWKEMFQVFNMGQRLEVYTNAEAATSMITIATKLGIDAQVSGYVARSDKKEVIVTTPDGDIAYS
jgi:phosphoribosylformylglycinamidine cyclo-ligase